MASLRNVNKVGLSRDCFQCIEEFWRSARHFEYNAQNNPASKLTMPLSLVGCDGLQGLHDACERVFLKSCYQHMNVIGHDYPGEQAIPLTIRTKEYILNQRRNAMILHESLAITVIEIFFDAHL